MDKYLIDGQKLQYHPRRVVQLLDGKHGWEFDAKKIYPIYVEVSPIGACNHRCTFCAVDYLGYESNKLDHVMMRDRFIEMGKLGVRSVMFAGEGEPLLHKHINHMVESAIQNDIDVSFTTNGALLDKLDPISNISWIKVSLNAGTRETYAKIHRTKEEDFDRVIQNLKDAVKRKGNCTIGAQMVVLPENQHEVELLTKIGKDIGLDYVVAKPYSQHRLSVTRKYDGFVSEVKQADGLITRKNAIETTDIPYRRCHSTPYLWAYLMANGDLYSCSAFLGDDRFNLGNVNKQTFQEIWQGEKRKQNWELMKTFDIGECRVNCRMNPCNKYLNTVIEGMQHVNFI